MIPPRYSLPFVTAHYVEATGDVAVLAEEVPFVTGIRKSVADVVDDLV